MTTKTSSPRGGAEFGACGRDRWRLWRAWGSGPRVAFVMLNPSTASADEDDPTIRKCMAYARRWEYHGIEVVNLFGLRATDPRELYRRDEAECVGDRNDPTILSATYQAGLVIVAWGNHGGLHKRSAAVLRMLEGNCEPHALAVTKHDQPWHPLYLAGDLVPFLWEGR